MISFEIILQRDGESLGFEETEDIVYSCLDLCMLRKYKPHFFLRGDEIFDSPFLRQLLDLLWEQNATFSLLSGAEKDAVVERNEDDIVVTILPDGSTAFGNVLQDRLADMMVGRCSDG